MTRALGIWCKKQEVMLAQADDGALVIANPQRLEAPPILEDAERLPGFLASFRHVLAEVQPDVVRILQPEQTYKAPYSEFAPKITLETLVRLACQEARVPVEVLHRSTARSRLGFEQKGALDKRIRENIEPVGKYWGEGRHYAAVAALAEEKKKK
jgi:hypothetical protein